MRVYGKLDFFHLDELTDALDDAASTDNQSVVINLENAELITSSAIGAIASFCEERRSKGGSIVLSGLKGQVESSLELTGVTDQLTVFETEKEAVNTLQ